MSIAKGNATGKDRLLLLTIGSTYVTFKFQSREADNKRFQEFVGACKLTKYKLTDGNKYSHPPQLKDVKHCFGQCLAEMAMMDSDKPLDQFRKLYGILCADLKPICKPSVQCIRGLILFFCYNCGMLKTYDEIYEACKFLNETSQRKSTNQDCVITFSPRKIERAYVEKNLLDIKKSMEIIVSSASSEHREHDNEFKALSIRFKAVIDIAIQMKSELEEAKLENGHLKEAVKEQLQTIQRLKAKDGERQADNDQRQKQKHREHQAEIDRLNKVIAGFEAKINDCVSTNAHYKKNDDEEKKKVEELTKEIVHLKAALDQLQQNSSHMISNFDTQKTALEAEIETLNASVKSSIKGFDEMKKKTDAEINRLTKSTLELENSLKAKDNQIKSMEEEIKRLSSNVAGDDEETFEYAGDRTKSVCMKDVVYDSRIDYELLSQKILTVYTCEDAPNGDSKVWAVDDKYITLKKSFQLFLKKELCCRENDVSTLLGHVFGCNLKKLVLEKQKLNYKEYVKLVSPGKIEELVLLNVTIMGEYDEPLRIDEILNDLPHVKNFTYEFRDGEATRETSKKLAKLSSLSNLQKLCLQNLQKGFKLKAFIKQNPHTVVDTQMKLHS